MVEDKGLCSRRGRLFVSCDLVRWATFHYFDLEDHLRNSTKVRAYRAANEDDRIRPRTKGTKIEFSIDEGNSWRYRIPLYLHARRTISPQSLVVTKLVTLFIQKASVIRRQLW